VAVSEELTAVLVLLIQPVNAALNPCLYLMGKVMEDRRQQQEARLRRMLKSRVMCRK
jgi:hypothetical protein